MARFRGALAQTGRNAGRMGDSLPAARALQRLGGGATDFPDPARTAFAFAARGSGSGGTLTAGPLPAAKQNALAQPLKGGNEGSMVEVLGAGISLPEKRGSDCGA